MKKIALSLFFIAATITCFAQANLAEMQRRMQEAELYGKESKMEQMAAALDKITAVKTTYPEELALRSKARYMSAKMMADMLGTAITSDAGYKKLCSQALMDINTAIKARSAAGENYIIRGCIQLHLFNKNAEAENDFNEAAKLNPSLAGTLAEARAGSTFFHMPEGNSITTAVAPPKKPIQTTTTVAAKTDAAKPSTGKKNVQALLAEYSAGAQKNDSAAILNRAELYVYDLKQYRNAITDLNSIYDKNWYWHTKDSVLHRRYFTARGEAYYGLKKYDSALKDFKDLRYTVNVGGTAALLNKCYDSLYKLRVPEEKLQASDKLVKEHEEKKMYVGPGDTLVPTFIKARNAFLQAINLNPLNDKAYGNLAELYRRMQIHDSAAVYFLKAHELDTFAYYKSAANDQLAIVHFHKIKNYQSPAGNTGSRGYINTSNRTNKEMINDCAAAINSELSKIKDGPLSMANMDVNNANNELKRNSRDAFDIYSRSAVSNVALAKNQVAFLQDNVYPAYTSQLVNLTSEEQQALTKIYHALTRWREELKSYHSELRKSQRTAIRNYSVQNLWQIDGIY
jgi:hypothetical protein